MKIILFLLLWLMTFSLSGQEVLFPKSQETRLAGIVHREEWAVNFKAHTNGLAIGYLTGELESYRNTKYRYYELGYIRHPKEFRQSVQQGIGVNIFVPGSSYVFGKQNSFIYAKTGFGRKKYLSDKAKRKGVAIGYTYEFGPSLGIVKPYLLDVSVESDQIGTPVIQQLRFTEENADAFLDRTAIRGYSGFFEGFGNTKFRIGGYAKASLLVSSGAYESFVKAFEVGIMVDGYTRRVPIMIIENNRFIFVNFFVSAQFGQRA